MNKPVTAQDLITPKVTTGPLIGSRKIYSNPFQGRPNLLDWGRAIQRAARADQGDGRALERALDSINAEIDSALRR